MCLHLNNLGEIIMSIHIDGVHNTPIRIDVSFLETSHRLVDAVNTAAVEKKKLSSAMRVTRKILHLDGEYIIGVFHHPTGEVPSGNKYRKWLHVLASRACESVNIHYINNIDDYLALIIDSDVPEEYLASVVFEQSDGRAAYAFIEHHSTPSAQEILSCNHYDECMSWLTVVICTKAVFGNVRSQLIKP